MYKRQVFLLLEQAGENARGDVADAVKNLVQGFRRFRPVPLGFFDLPAELALAQVRQLHDLLEEGVEDVYKRQGYDEPSLRIGLFLPDGLTEAVFQRPQQHNSCLLYTSRCV